MWSDEFHSQKLVSAFLFAFGLVLVVLIYGAVPFLALPTLGQALWTTGFSWSFANESMFSIHALEIGTPKPAAIAFGLAGAYPAGLFITAGMHAADAYAAMCLLWLTLAYWGAWRIALWAGVSRTIAVLPAVLWLSMPMIWAHASYSMLSLGFALLSFYFWSFLKLFSQQFDNKTEKKRVVLLYLFACFLAVFMDGYSFFMFAIGSSLLGAYIFTCSKERRRHLVRFAIPVHIISFALAYFSYSIYIGKSQFDAETLDFFRSWGADLTFFAAPTLGKHWLWDVLGLSIFRSGRNFFGDSSTWTTTFSLPIIIVGLFAWFRTRTRNTLASGFLLIALFGFYMALGPSLKVNSTRPPEMIAAEQLYRPMPAGLAVASTGNAWLSENLPGFKNMRAAYRWTALGIFGLWVLIVMMMAREKGRAGRLALAVVFFLILSNLPNLERQLRQAMSNRDKFLRIDKELVADLKSVVSHGELIAFLPYRNDFLVNYLSPRLGVRTYNIGGDKNLFEARKHWPPIMQQFQMGLVDTDFVNRVLLLLARKDADAVVLPYIDLLWAAYVWPAPRKYKKELTTVVEALLASKYLLVEERQYYAIARIAPPFLQQVNDQLLEEKIIYDQIIYPLDPPRSCWALPEGWHVEGTEYVWSKERASLNLPVPDNCTGQSCFALITFSVFGASEDRPVTVRFALESSKEKWVETYAASRSEDHKLIIPMPKRKGVQRLGIEVPQATSPSKLGLSSDSRTLGIALRSVDMGTISYPIEIGSEESGSLALALKDGWHNPEAQHVWSKERASLNLPVPGSCTDKSCLALIRFIVFGASEQNPVTVRFILQGGDKPWLETITAVLSEQAIAIPFDGQKDSLELLIEVPQATSPSKMGLSNDSRTLGIALLSVEIDH